MKQLGQIADNSKIDALDTFVAYCAPMQGIEIGYLYSFAGKRYKEQYFISALQFFCPYNDTNIFFRSYNVYSYSWNPWKKIAVTT